MKTYFIAGRLKEAESSSAHINASDSNLAVSSAGGVLTFQQQQQSLCTSDLQQQPVSSLPNMSFRKVCFYYFLKFIFVLLL